MRLMHLDTAWFINQPSTCLYCSVNLSMGQEFHGKPLGGYYSIPTFLFCGGWLSSRFLVGHVRIDCITNVCINLVDMLRAHAFLWVRVREFNTLSSRVHILLLICRKAVRSDCQFVLRCLSLKSGKEK